MSGNGRPENVAVVTGAGRGLGTAIANHLASSGYALALCSRTEDEVARVAADLRRRFGVEVLANAVDVSDHSAVCAFADRVQHELGPVTALINNAAVLGPVGRLTPGDLAEWSRAIDINLKGPAYLVAAFIGQLAAGSAGRIVGFSGGGVGGPSPMQRCSAYVSAKAGLAALTELVALELADVTGSGTTINAIAPGALPTGFLAGVLAAGAERAGDLLYEDAKGRGESLPDELLSPVFRLLDFVLSLESQWLTGRLLSAKWDSPDKLRALRTADVEISPQLYRLRRIDDDLYGCLS